jgi:hypothetical protein
MASLALVSAKVIFFLARDLRLDSLFAIRALSALDMPFKALVCSFLGLPADLLGSQIRFTAGSLFDLLVGFVKGITMIEE